MISGNERLELAKQLQIEYWGWFVGSSLKNATPKKIKRFRKKVQRLIAQCEKNNDIVTLATLKKITDKYDESTNHINV